MFRGLVYVCLLSEGVEGVLRDIDPLSPFQLEPVMAVWFGLCMRRDDIQVPCEQSKPGRNHSGDELIGVNISPGRHHVRSHDARPRGVMRKRRPLFSRLLKEGGDGSVLLSSLLLQFDK